MKKIIWIIIVFILFIGCSSKTILDKKLFKEEGDNNNTAISGEPFSSSKSNLSIEKKIKYNTYILKNTSKFNRDLFIKFLEKENHYKEPHIIMSETTIDVPISLGKLDSREFNIENRKLVVKIFNGNNITIKDIVKEMEIVEDETFTDEYKPPKKKIVKKKSTKKTLKKRIKKKKKETTSKIEEVAFKSKIRKKLVVVDNSEYFSNHGLSKKIKSEVKKLFDRGNTDIIILSSSGTVKSDNRKLHKLDYSGTANRFILPQFSNIIKDNFSDKYSHITYFTGMKITSKPDADKISNITMFRVNGGKVNIRTISSNCSKLRVYVNGCRGF